MDSSIEYDVIDDCQVQEDWSRKVSTSWYYETDPIVVIDPMNPTNNLGKSCFNVYQIKQLFRKSYQQLMYYQDLIIMIQRQY